MFYQESKGTTMETGLMEMIPEDMKLMSTEMHGMMDYPTAATLMASPWLFDFADEGGAEMIIPLVLGGSSILASMMTDYEMGLMPVIDMKTHLMLDIGSGALLALSPFLFGFAKKTWAPHVMIGLMEIATALMTKTEPRGSTRKRGTSSRRKSRSTATAPSMAG
jgi:hypothetical protein